MAKTTCPITGAPAEELDPTGDRRDFISPSLGGRYGISGTVLATWEPLDSRQRDYLARLINERRRAGEECPVILSYDLDAMNEHLNS